MSIMSRRMATLASAFLLLHVVFELAAGAWMILALSPDELTGVYQGVRRQGTGPYLRGGGAVMIALLAVPLLLREKGHCVLKMFKMEWASAKTVGPWIVRFMYGVLAEWHVALIVRCLRYGESGGSSMLLKQTNPNLTFTMWGWVQTTMSVFAGGAGWQPVLHCVLASWFAIQAITGGLGERELYGGADGEAVREAEGGMEAPPPAASEGATRRAKKVAKVA